MDVLRDVHLQRRRRSRRRQNLNPHKDNETRADFSR
jgi:hypothetical protein